MNTPVDTNAKREDIASRIYDALPAMIMEEMTARRDAGLLSPYRDHAAYMFSYPRVWNLFIEDPQAMQKWELNDLALIPQLIFYMKALTLAGDIEKEMGDTPEAYARAFTEIRAIVAAGTNPYGPGMSGEVSSPVVEGKFFADLEDWSLKIVQANPLVTYANRKDRTIPRHIDPAPIAVKPVVHMQINLPTGNLIMADWIRIPAFTEHVWDQLADISRAQVRIDMAVKGIKAHKVIEVACGNSMPSIILEADKSGTARAQLRFGIPVYVEDSDELVNPYLNEIGSITTDVSTITIMDESDLKDVLVGLGLDALAEIKKWEDGSWGRGATRVSVDPGLWHLYFVEYRAVKGIEELENVTRDLGTGLETIVLLTQTPIDLEPEYVLEA